MRRVFILFCLVFVAALVLAGCGETFNGAIKDSKRIGTGIKTVFVRE